MEIRSGLTAILVDLDYLQNWSVLLCIGKRGRPNLTSSDFRSALVKAIILWLDSIDTESMIGVEQSCWMNKSIQYLQLLWKSTSGTCRDAFLYLAREVTIQCLLTESLCQIRYKQWSPKWWNWRRRLGFAGVIGGVGVLTSTKKQDLQWSNLPTGKTLYWPMPLSLETAASSVRGSAIKANFMWHVWSALRPS